MIVYFYAYCWYHFNSFKFVYILPLRSSFWRQNKYIIIIIITDYSPISLLSQLSKILEKLFNGRLQQFLNTNNILSNSHYGFREHMSTVHAESIYNSIDSKQHCAGVFNDLKKAFYTINHKLLVDKLAFYGNKRDRKYMVRNYLMNRKQYVVIDNQAFSMHFIKCGVGPYLKVQCSDQFCSSCL